MPTYENSYCPNHQQSRVVILNDLGQEIFREILKPPIREIVSWVETPWPSRVQWSWGGSYQQIVSSWRINVPLQALSFERVGSRYYLFARDHFGVYVNGQKLSASGQSLPSYPITTPPGGPNVDSYLDPPPEPQTFTTQLVDARGDVGYWTQVGTKVEVAVECSCTNDEIQCGVMDKFQDNTFCCHTCASIGLSIVLSTRQIEAMTRRFE